MSNFSHTKLKTRLIETVFHNTCIAVAGNIFLGACATAFYWPYLDAWYVLIWFIGLVGVCLLRLLLRWMYGARETVYKQFSERQWIVFFSVLCVAGGAFWGAALNYVIRMLPLSESMVILSIGFALATVAIGMMAAVWWVYVAYLTALLFPLIFLFVSQSGQFELLGLLSTAFYGFNLISSRKMYQVLRQSIIHQLSNDRLYMALQNEKDRVMSLNRQLEMDVRAGKRTAQELLAQKHEAEQLAERLHTLSAIDGLTGIANRRTFDEVLEREWSRAKRQHAPLSLLLVDIDHFKLLNDHYGHQYGDQCLKSVVDVMRSHLKRPSDFIARYGGEEFVVILPMTTAGAAQSLAEEIREAVANARMEHQVSPVLPFVTISIGLSCMCDNEILTAKTLFEKADTALYAAKMGGRNRVC
ncbi:diguanylate cyclase [Neptunomonas concharum]|uniref:diguanylate cyclase n=1 Tax=Neptunomonas concharum TaxID=1031538 RepID=A0A5P1RF38_9GAMM|nr:diguanylate cyclase [Neptunomonas concharum]